MKKQEKINSLKEEIKSKAKQLEQLNAHVDKSNICSDLYNKVVLEKAELTKQLKDLETNTLMNKVKKVLPHKKTLICDYFKG